MKKILNIAKTENIVRIYGYVTQDDINEFSGLLAWYEKLGYKISEPDGKEIVAAKKMISMTL